MHVNNFIVSNIHFIIAESVFIDIWIKINVDAESVSALILNASIDAVSVLAVQSKSFLFFL